MEKLLKKTRKINYISYEWLKRSLSPIGLRRAVDNRTFEI